MAYEYIRRVSSSLANQPTSGGFLRIAAGSRSHSSMMNEMVGVASSRDK